MGHLAICLRHPPTPGLYQRQQARRFCMAPFLNFEPQPFGRVICFTGLAKCLLFFNDFLEKGCPRQLSIRRLVLLDCPKLGFRGVWSGGGGLGAALPRRRPSSPRRSGGRLPKGDPSGNDARFGFRFSSGRMTQIRRCGG